MSIFPADRTLRIGTRSSPMALAQIELVSALLRKLAHSLVPANRAHLKWA